MTERRAGFRFVLLLLALALVAAGCRGDDGDGAAAPGATEGAATEPAPGATDGATDGEPATGDDEIEEAEIDGIATDVGVTAEPCPDAVNADNGCIYLGTISDLTVGPFAALAVPITDAQSAYWNRVNEEGGIGGFDIDVTTWVRDNQYLPDVHNQVWQEMRNDVLALAQTLGSPTTAAILSDLEARDVVAVPANWTSANLYSDVILESGNVYCVETSNGVDWAFENRGPYERVMAVHYPGDYGDDAAAGVRNAAEANGAEFISVETSPGQDNQGEAISRIAADQPDLVYITTGPTDAAVVMGQAAAAGFQGQFIGSGPTWNPGLLQSPAAAAIESLYIHNGPWASYGADTAGHQAMRDALGDVQPNDGYTSGWAWQYPLEAALRVAAENGDLTRAGLLEAATSLTSVDYEGMLPEEAGNFAGDPADTAVRGTYVSEPSADADAGLAELAEFYTGPSLDNLEFTGPCFDQL
jgi:ABC-type branched-subunit amino acid transport system substrate-binding protein